MSTFFLRYHILWLTLFCGLVILVEHTPLPTILHVATVFYLLAYLFILLPQFLSHSLFQKIWSLSDTFFAGLIFFFFIFTPLFYFGEHVSLLHLRASDILLLLLSCIFLSYFKGFFQKLPKTLAPLPNTHWLRNPEIILLIGFLILFFIIHALYFHFYQFLPEWDGYSDISAIEKNITAETFHQSYRAFFQASISLLSVLLGAMPYTLFVYLIIPLQATLLIVLYKFFQLYSVRNLKLQTLFYLTILSVPVLAMEIDMSRPQNILIIFVPIIFYLLALFEKHREYTLLVPMFLIVIGGLGYHEFFWFFLLAFFIIAPFHYSSALKKLYQKPVLFWSSITLVVVFGSIIFNFSSTLYYFFFKTMLEVSNISQWRLWFLGNYSNSGQIHTNVGWSGIRGTIQYYGYYLSPVIFFCITFLLLQYKKMTRQYLSSLTGLYFIVLLGIWVTFMEILPRLNSPFLPERYWLFFNITFIFFFLSFVAKNNFDLVTKKVFFALLLISCLLGIGATFYIAMEKRSLTTHAEYQTALWLKTHTEQNAVIVSQPGNMPMIRNFAGRELLVPVEGFFLNPTYTSPLDNPSPERLERILRSLELSGKKETLPVTAQFRRMLADKQTLKERPLYILYSEQKFSTLYSGRDWYQKQNFKDAKLEKFDASLEKIYSREGISIWKVKY